MRTVKSILNFIPWTFLLIISGIVYYQADLLVWALIIGYITSNFISVIHHLYWAHGYVVPKNRFIKTILDLIGYVSWPSIFLHPKSFWTYTHWYHHQFWGTSKDFVEIKDNTVSFIRYVIFRPILSLFFKLEHNKNINNNMDRLAIYTENMIASNQNKTQPLVDKYYRSLTVIIHLSLLLLIGMKYYFYFVFFQIWLYTVQLALFGEYIPHAKNIPEQTEKNYPWLFLLAPEYAYHCSHHRYGALILGPGKLKYLNIQYFFIRLLYNIQTKIII